MRLIRWAVRSLLKMMYILTSEELDKLVSKKKLDKANAALKWLREHVMEACPYSPTKCKKHDYCSNCWLSHMGPKMPASERPPEEISRAICPLTREYPK
jgi:hypothetical protein